MKFLGIFALIGGVFFLSLPSPALADGCKVLVKAELDGETYVKINVNERFFEKRGDTKLIQLGDCTTISELLFTVSSCEMNKVYEYKAVRDNPAVLHEADGQEYPLYIVREPLDETKKGDISDFDC